LAPIRYDVAYVLTGAWHREGRIPHQEIVDRHDALRARRDADERSPAMAIVYQRIVHQENLVSRPAIALSSKRHHIRVLGLRPLLNNIANNVR
jgi:hypothetical protein